MYKQFSCFTIAYQYIFSSTVRSANSGWCQEISIGQVLSLQNSTSFEAVLENWVRGYGVNYFWIPLLWLRWSAVCRTQFPGLKDFSSKEYSLWFAVGHAKRKVVGRWQPSVQSEEPSLIAELESFVGQLQQLKELRQDRAETFRICKPKFHLIASCQQINSHAYQTNFQLSFSPNEKLPTNASTNTSKNEHSDKPGEICQVSQSNLSSLGVP
jgi:hypothetical protein